jgi:NADP-dependent alcohol dehydrogenase
MNIKRKEKKDKILQYGKRIWGINSGTDDEKIDAAISKTIAFFESLGLPTTLPAYNVPKESVTKIVARFEKRKYKLGEKADIGFQEIEQILMDRM